MRQEIIDYVYKNDHVTFVELQRLFGERAKGDLEIATPFDPNIVIWSGISEELVETLKALLSEEVVLLQPASLLSYMVDGGMPALPVAQRLPKGGYKTPHWAPMYLCIPTPKRLAELRKTERETN